MTRVALVTGGGRGLGREIALALARAGCAVAVGARSRDEVERVAGEARETGARALAVTVDVRDAGSIREALATAVRELGPIDILVNNAGIAESAPFLKTEPDLWERHLAVNVTGPYLLTRAVLAGMLERGWGRIINVASLAGLHGAAYVAAYVASKHALVGLTRALAIEVAGRGVTVNAICPGYAATDMVWASARRIVARTGKSYDDAVAAMAAWNPGGRLIEPAEVADTVVRLVEDDKTNGEAIVLDGTGATSAHSRPPAVEPTSRPPLQRRNP